MAHADQYQIINNLSPRCPSKSFDLPPFLCQNISLPDIFDTDFFEMNNSQDSFQRYRQHFIKNAVFIFGIQISIIDSRGR